MSNEFTLVKNIVKRIEKEYPDAWHFKVVGHPYQRSGVPDILVVVRGVLFGLEVKHQKPGESEQHARDRASALQQDQLAQIRAAEGYGAVVLSVEESLQVIEDGLRHHFERGL